MNFRVNDPFWAVPGAFRLSGGVMWQHNTEGGATPPRWANAVAARRNRTIHEEDKSNLMNSPD